MIEAERDLLLGPDLPLDRAMRGARTLLSIDVDYFTGRSASIEAPALIELVRAAVRRGVPLCHDEQHVALTTRGAFPFDVAVNVDYHMDCRQEYLFGAVPKRPPCDATVFEDLLTTHAIGRYVWVLPPERRPQAARLYAAATLCNAQPTLRRIHILDDWRQIERLMAALSIAQIFVCRSPGYGTSDTDELYRTMIALSSTHGGN